LAVVADDGTVPLSRAVSLPPTRGGTRGGLPPARDGRMPLPEMRSAPPPPTPPPVTLKPVMTGSMAPAWCE